MIRTLAVGGALLSFMLAGPVIAADCDPSIGKNLYTAWKSKTPVSDLPAGLPDREARCIRYDFVRALDNLYGPRVGYKIALTSKAVQAKFGLDAPVSGRILKLMLLTDGAVLPNRYGARPVLEADLLVRISSARINDATSPAEALRHLSHIWPAIEAADLLLAPEIKPDAGRLTAINAGARWFVTGRPQELRGTPDELREIGEIAVSFSILRARETLADGNASAIMGHPLKALLWLRDELKKDGRGLAQGDIVSLGSLTPPFPPRKGEIFRAHFTRFPGGPRSVHVTFP